ncbi:uncharacterized protein [Branchiostoma lanceolatum]|uniref:uncharacterized protein n=1 Tax=Branchiostoma lanceolatum TaxID=7740 RepID=UPI0034512773
MEEAHRLFAAGLLGGALALLLTSFFPFGLRHSKDLSCVGPSGPVQWWLVYPDVNLQGWMYVDNTSPAPLRMDSIPRQSDPVIRTLNSVTRDVSRLQYPSDSGSNDKLKPQGFLAYTLYSGVWVSYVGSTTGKLGDDTKNMMTCATIKGEKTVSQAVAIVMAHNPRLVQPEATSRGGDLQEAILLGQQFHMMRAFEAHWECLHSTQASLYTSCYRSIHTQGVSASARIGSPSAQIGSASSKVGSRSAGIGKPLGNRPVCIGMSTSSERGGGFQITVVDCRDGEVPTAPSQPLFALVGNPEVDTSHVVCAGNLLRTEGAADLLCVSHPELWLTLKQAGRTASVDGKPECGVKPCGAESGADGRKEGDQTKETPVPVKTGEAESKPKEEKKKPRKTKLGYCVQNQGKET